MGHSQEYVYMDTATRGTSNRNRVMRYSDYNPSPETTDCFATYFRFTEDLVSYMKANTAKTGKPSVAGYPGPAFAPFLPFDFDSEEDPAYAVAEARHFARLWRRWGLDPEGLRIYWSGNKGISVEVPGDLFGGFEPHRDIHLRLKSLAKSMTPDSETLDTSIYEKVRLWRLPNTRHGVSGLYKVPLAARELEYPEYVRELARSPRSIGSASSMQPVPALIGLYEDAALAATSVPPGSHTRVSKPSDSEVEGSTPDLTRLSGKMRHLIERGNHGEYGSRSEADMAVCTAMSRAGYTVEEIWSIMTNPSNGIADKFSEKGQWGEIYLELTISKASEFSSTRTPGRGKVYARRRGEIRIG